MLAGAEGDGDFRDTEERLKQLRDSWSTLQEETSKRLQRLEEASEAQRYYLDAGEAEAWISEQELYMGTDEKPKVKVLILPEAAATPPGRGGGSDGAAQ